MLGFGLWKNRAFIHDDAFITLRYARNLIEGHGLVWNMGEQVEGYTSLAAVMLAAAVGLVGLDLVTAARLVNLLAALGMAGFLLAFCRHLERGPGTSAVAHALPVMLVLASRPLAAWILGGLEGPLFAAVVAVSAGNVLLLLQEPRSKSLALRAGFWLGLAVLVRPDGLVFGVMAAAFLLLRLGRPGRAGLAVFGRFAAAWLGLPCAHALWRLSYYGALVPNTLIAKATGLPRGVEGEGLKYLTGFLLSPPYLVLLVLVVPALLVRARRLQVLFLLACIAGYAGLVVRVGGDHMPASRLFLPLVPLCALVVFFGLARLLRGARWPVAATVSLYAMALLVVQERYSKPLQSDPAAFMGTIVGRYLNETREPGTLVALNTAGSTPYFASSLRYIDMLGLLDPHIAHRDVPQTRLSRQRMSGHFKGDGRYVLERDPDIVIIGPAEGAAANAPWFLTDLELSEDPRFHDRYRLSRTTIDVRAYRGYEHHRATREGVMALTYYERVRPSGALSAH